MVVWLLFKYEKDFWISLQQLCSANELKVANKKICHSDWSERKRAQWRNLLFVASSYSFQNFTPGLSAARSKHQMLQAQCTS